MQPAILTFFILQRYFYVDNADFIQSLLIRRIIQFTYVWPKLHFINIEQSSSRSHTFSNFHISLSRQSKFVPVVHTDPSKSQSTELQKCIFFEVCSNAHSAGIIAYTMHHVMKDLFTAVVNCCASLKNVQV